MPAEVLALQKKRKAISWDLDDTLIRREWVTRVGGAIVGKIKKHKIAAIAFKDILELDRTVTDTSVTGLAEKISFAAHSQRRVFEGAAELLARAKTNGNDNFVNTGRKNKKSWVEMSQNTLEHGGIADLVDGYYFTPEESATLKKVSTTESKAAALKKLCETYEQVSHIDDDPRTIFALAKLFPDVKFYLVRYGSTGMLYHKKELKKYPNVQRIGRIKPSSYQARLQNAA